MSDKYLTRAGRDGISQEVSQAATSAILFQHDVLKRAVKERLDLYVLRGSAGEGPLKAVWGQSTGTTFAEQIRDVLRAGRNVSMLIWLTEPTLSPDLTALMREAENNVGWGRLDIRISGTESGSDRLMHFLVAKSRDDERWIVRVESPHPTISRIEDVESFEVPAALFFGGPEAERTGRELLSAFSKLFSATSGREVDASNVKPQG